MANKQQTQRWTMALKARDVLAAGVGREVIPTMQLVTDYSANNSGNVKIDYGWMAQVLGVCERTVRRHVEALVEAGLLARIHRTRDRRGRYGAWVLRVVHIAQIAAERVQGRAEKGRGRRGKDGKTASQRTTGHERTGGLYKRSRHISPPLSPPSDEHAGDAKRALDVLRSWTEVAS